MHSVSIFSALALAGAAFAAPIAEPDVVKVVQTVVQTVVVTEGVPQAKPTPAPAPAEDKPVAVKNYGRPQGNQGKPKVVVVTATYGAAPPAKPTTSAAPPPAKPTTSAAPPPAKPTTSAAPPPAKPTTYAAPPPAKPTTSAAPAQPTGYQPAPSTGGSGGGYMDIVKEWRSKMGLPELKHDAQLEANARKTCADGKGQMVHQLNKGTMGQVLAPGKEGDFLKVFVGGWLCEVPSTPGLNGICDSMSKGWNYMGQTGHNQILTDKSKSKIGCAEVDGIWGCDLA